MRPLLFASIAVLLALAASALIWRDLLNPALAPLPPMPSSHQQRFGTRVSATMLAQLDQPLPENFPTAGDLDTTIQSVRDATRLNIFVNWRALEAEGVTKRSPVTARNLGGERIADALYQIFNEQHPPLACDATDDVLTISTRRDLAANTVTRVYDVRNLVGAQPPRSTAALEKEITLTVAPDSWRNTSPDGTGSMRGISGQLIVTAAPLVQRDVLAHLNERFRSKARMEFAKRAASLTAATLLVVILIQTLGPAGRRRRRSLQGLCARCGYDLRASPDRCPECGQPAGAGAT